VSRVRRTALPLSSSGFRVVKICSAEQVGVDDQGNVYGAVVRRKMLEAAANPDVCVKRNVRFENFQAGLYRRGPETWISSGAVM
jgi:hypothetical protein